MKKKISQLDLIKEYFKNRPLKDIPHSEAVKWLMSEYQKRTGKVFADPDRGIRTLSQNGFLIKIAKGVYRYDPKFVKDKKLEDFTEKQKKEILERDGYRCVICGKGKKDGVELHVDHIKPKDLGGKTDIINGQTLCAKHNFRGKNYNQTETGKEMYIDFYNIAKSINDIETMKFCEQILKVFEKNGVNGHIEWKK